MEMNIPWNEAVFRAAIAQLQENSYTIIESFLDKDIIREMAEEIKILKKK